MKNQAIVLLSICILSLVISAVSADDSGVIKHNTDVPKTRKITKPVYHVVDASDEAIEQFYQKNKELFVTDKMIRVKSIVTGDKDSATEACKRVRAGENVDELIAEYFVPYFANKRGKNIEKHNIDNSISERYIKDYCKGESETGPLVGMKVGDVSDPMPRFGKGPEWAVLKIISTSEGYTATLDEVSDCIYSILWYKSADRSLIKEVNLGNNSWCGTCRAGRDVNWQLWELAQKYDKEGQVDKAVSACLLALNESRNHTRYRDRKYYEGKLYPEEKYLADHGLDLVRYYFGNMRHVQLHSPAAGSSRLGQIKDDRITPLLMNIANSGGDPGWAAAGILARMKVRKVIPILKNMIKDDTISICELHRGGDIQTVSFYAYYYKREEVKRALKLLSEDTSDVKIEIGKKFTFDR